MDYSQYNCALDHMEDEENEPDWEKIAGKNFI